MAVSSPFFPTPARSLLPSGLVGREREEQRLGALLAASVAGQGCLVLVGGEAGIGKTALVRAVAAEAAAYGAAVLIGGCYDLSVTPPYGPWREALACLPSGDELPPLPAALTDVDGPAPGGETALFRQVHDFLAAVTATRPAVAVLEDLHWADLASLDMLRYLARHVASLPLLLVATYRADEVTRRHPLAQLLPTLVREAPTERIDLHRLDEAALHALVASRYPLPAEAEARLVAHLQYVAEGNPFYAQELLRSLEEERVLCPGDPRWTLGNLARVRVPALLQQVVEGRLARLGEAARGHLAVAAVVGQRVPLAVWQAAGGLGEDDVLLTVERAVEARLLEAGEDGSEVAFAHALVREVLYAGILPPRRRVWHRRVAEVTAGLPTPDPDAVAYHFAQAGDARAADWLVRAGDRAFRAYAWLTARDRFLAALALLEGDPARAGERGWLLYRLGRLLRLSDPGQGIGYLEEAERVAHAVDDPLLAAYALADRGLLLCILAQVERGVESLAAGVAALEALPADQARPDPAVREWIADALRASVVPTPAGDTPPATGPLAARRGTLASWLGHTGRFAEARAMGEAYLAQVVGAGQPDALVLGGIGDAEFAVAVAEAAMGRPAAARAAWRRGQEAFRAIDHHFLVGLALGLELTEVMLPYYTTDVGARRALVAEATAAWARAGGAFRSTSDGHLLQLDVLLLEGAWTEADPLARAALGEVDPLVVQQAVLVLAGLARWRGEPVEAWGHLGAGLPQGPATEPGSHRFWYATGVQRLAADLALDAGDLPTAAAWLAAHDAWLGWGGGVRGQSEGRRLWARYHRVAGDPDRAREHATEAVALATAPRQPLALLAAHRLLGELATEAGRFAEARAAPGRRPSAGGRLRRALRAGADAPGVGRAPRHRGQAPGGDPAAGGGPRRRRAAGRGAAARPRRRPRRPAGRAASRGRRRAPALGAGGRGAAAGGGGAVEPRDRRGPLRQPAYRHHPPDPYLRQARGGGTGGGGRLGRPARPDLTRRSLPRPRFDTHRVRTIRMAPRAWARRHTTPPCQRCAGKYDLAMRTPSDVRRDLVRHDDPVPVESDTRANDERRRP